MEQKGITSVNPKVGGFLVSVTDQGSGAPIAHARITWEGPFTNNQCVQEAGTQTGEAFTEPNGSTGARDLSPGWYRLTCEAFYLRDTAVVDVRAGCVCTHSFELRINLKMETLVLK